MLFLVSTFWNVQYVLDKIFQDFILIAKQFIYTP